MNDQTFLIQETIPGECCVHTYYLESVESTTTSEMWANHSRNALRFSTVEEAEPTARKARERHPHGTINIVMEGGSL